MSNEQHTKGPWDDEPDSRDFKQAGLDCAMRRNHSGAWCGYVGVPEGHPLHGKNYSDYVQQPEGFGEREVDDTTPVIPMMCLDKDRFKRGEVSIDLALEAHGGITYTGTGWPDESKDLWWFGFDCSHAGDLVPGLMDYTQDGIYRNEAYVEDQCRKLADQLAAWVPTPTPEAEIARLRVERDEALDALEGFMALDKTFTTSTEAELDAVVRENRPAALLASAVIAARSILRKHGRLT